MKSHLPVYLCWKTVSTEKKDLLAVLENINKIITIWVSVKYYQPNMRVVFYGKQFFHRCNINYLHLYHVRLQKWMYVSVV